MVLVNCSDHIVQRFFSFHSGLAGPARGLMGAAPYVGARNSPLSQPAISRDFIGSPSATRG